MVSITLTLAHSVDSLVRVSRRLVKDRVTTRGSMPATDGPVSLAAQQDSIYLPPREARFLRIGRSLKGHPARENKRGSIVDLLTAEAARGTPGPQHARRHVSDHQLPDSSRRRWHFAPPNMARSRLRHGSYTLGAQRCQRLFHSLSKVLFIFRSHYLFTIGLGAIFSLGRTTPPILYSTLKLHDSWNPATPCTKTLRAIRHTGTGR